MRICPKCSAYSADHSLAFCLVDGTPLVNVDPSSQSWSEGVRRIEENEKALWSQLRKSKRKRVLMSTVTIVMVSLVVFVMTMNGIIYLKPSQEPEKFVAMSEPAPTPAPASPSPDVTENSPSPTPSPSVSPTPKPSVSPTPRPSVTPRSSPTASPPTIESQTQTPECSEDDKGREKEMILKKFAKTWRDDVLRDRVKTAEGPGRKGNGSNVGSAEPRIVIAFKSCYSASVTITYAVQMISLGAPTRPPVVLSVPKVKRFTCQKAGITWNCE